MLHKKPVHSACQVKQLQVNLKNKKSKDEGYQKQKSIGTRLVFAKLLWQSAPLYCRASCHKHAQLYPNASISLEACCFSPSNRSRQQKRG